MIATLLYYLNPINWIPSIETILLIGTLIGLLVLYVHKKWQVLKKYGIDGPPPSWKKLGNMSDFLDPKFFTKDKDLIKEYGSVIGRYFLTGPRIMISDPDILKQIMIKEFKTFPNRQERLLKIMGNEFSNSLTQVKGEQWKRQRTTLTPTFASSRMRELFSVIFHCVDSAIDNLHDKIKTQDGVVNAKDEFGSISMNCIIRGAFGANLDDQQAEVASKMKSMLSADITKDICIFIAALWPRFEDIIDYFDYSIFPKEDIGYFKKLTTAVVRARKQHGSDRVDLLQLMLNAERSPEEIKEDPSKGLTEIEIKGTALLMFLAGYETTAFTLQCLAYELAIHTDIQEKIRQEVHDAVERNDGKITFDVLRELKYLEMCINETLRLYPIAPINIRVAQKEITLNGVTIPKGANIDIPVYALLRSEDHWEEPEKFMPERMEDMSQIDPLVFQPFGAGPRICIGMRFAMMEMKLTFARMVQEFRFVATDQTAKYPVGLMFAGAGVMKPDEEIIFKLEAL